MFNVILDYSDDDKGDDSGDDEGDDEIAWADLLEGINQLYHLRLHVGSMTKKQGKCLFGGKFDFLKVLFYHFLYFRFLYFRFVLQGVNLILVFFFLKRWTWMVMQC